MGWKEARNRYANLTVLSDQKVEDLVARRVLRGLGLTEKQIWDAERVVFGFVKDDKALWVRTFELLKAVWKSQAIWGGELNIEVISSTNHKDVLDRIVEIANSGITPPVFMTRTKGSGISLTYDYFQVGFGTDEHELQPPYTVLAEVMIPGSGEDKVQQRCRIVVQDTELFVSQFGPYTWLINQMARPR